MGYLTMLAMCLVSAIAGAAKAGVGFPGLILLSLVGLVLMLLVAAYGVFDR